ncbi:hypothetical protein GC170_14465 [bacterium]|nr:hypothetical protein [bacterium]
MLIPFEDLIHTITVYRRENGTGHDGEPTVRNVDPVTVRGIVCPRSGSVNRDTKEFVRTGTLVLCEHHIAIVANRWIEARDDAGTLLLAGTIEEAIDPNNLHDHLELQVVDTGEGRSE